MDRLQRRFLSVLVLNLSASLFLLTHCVSAGDWPQLLGPNRNGVAESETLLKTWPAAGPETLWTVPVGSGFSGVAVSGKKVLVFDRTQDREVVRCLNTVNGEELWKSESPCGYAGGVSSDTGPRCVPMIAGNRVYTFGVQGRLRCLAVEDGREIWQRDTAADFRPPEGYFGVGSSPVISGDRLIVNVGGRDTASIVAFSTTDGATLWKAFSDAASYSSPVTTRVAATDLVVVVTRLHVVGIDPQSGAVNFSVPFGARGPTVNGASPIIVGNRIFVSSSYHIGSLLIDASSSKAREVWRDEELLATQYATPVRSKQNPAIVFAVDGRQDAGAGSASLKCIDLDLQKVLWEQTGFDYGTLVRVDDDLLMLTCAGELIRAAASEKSYQERNRSSVLASTSSGYRLPAVSNGRLYIRDDSTLKCLRIGIE